MNRAPLALGVLGALLAAAGTANAQVGSANVPLPNVLLLLDTSGSFEHMIDGSNPEDPQNNVAPNYANCEKAWYTGGPLGTGGAALPNRWGVAVQALTGTVLNATGQPYYSCVTMDRVDGATVTGVPAPFALSPAPAAGSTAAIAMSNGLDAQYGIRNEGSPSLYSFPYDSGYYLNFHRPVSQTAAGRCVYSPGVLPGAVHGGVGTGTVAGQGVPAPGDCPNEPSGLCTNGDFPADAIGQFLYDSFPSPTGPTPIGVTTLTTPNLGYVGTDTACVFNQATDGFIDQASTLVRFGLMTFDNDTNPSIGENNTGTTTAPVFTLSGYTASPFVGQWSYYPGWDSTTPTSWITGLPAGCTTNPPPAFELGARNPGAPPWEGRLVGFPGVGSDVLATAYSNSQIQMAINAMRPYGATPTAALMADAAYYYWGDPTGPNGTTPDPFVSGGCRSQYIILLTDGGPNQDLRTACQASGGSCPYHLPEETAYILANGQSDPGGAVAVTPPPPSNGKVYTYVIGFAVSGDNQTTLANCAQLAASGALAGQCGATTTPATSTPTTATATFESPCCSLQRIAVAGGTGQAYFADTPGDLDAALAAVLGDIEGQLGSRTLPVASPTVSYSAGTPLTATFLSTFHGSTCPATGPCVNTGPWTGDVQRQDYVCGAAGAGAVVTPESGDDFQTDMTGSQGLSRNFLFFNAWANSGTTGTNSLTIRPYLNVEHVILNSVAGGTVTADNLDAFGQYTQSGTEVNNFGQGGTVTGIYTSLTTNCTAAGCPALATTPTSCQDPATTGYTDPTTCSNLALSFAMAEPTFPVFTSTTAANNLASQYASGVDGNNSPPPGTHGTNRAGTPLGAVLDSTPAVVGPPAAQVRDDSYQAFATALSPLSLSTTANSAPRNTMLYVATVDGLLHAFDTTVGLPVTAPAVGTPLSHAEAWAFIPPAVLPHLVSNYPGANNILLDGAPVVKDVVFSRSNLSGQYPWMQEWHTMLVAGFGSGGRGYYALDVTDPRFPTSADAAATTTQFTASNQAYPTQVGSTQGLTGPHFQWQITSPNIVNNPNLSTVTTVTDIFGQVSGTPAIASVFADPTLPVSGTPQPLEIGIAILPGGRNGQPVPGRTCPRELATANFGQYKTSASLYSGSYADASQLPSSNINAFNLTDPNFPPRVNVRQWAANCTGTNSNVPGRSMMIVSIATGQVLAVFARAKSPTTYVPNDPTSWDVPSYGSQGTSIIDPSYLVNTPLDSPMTGVPVVYPSGVGVVAQAVYIGDADGTMWRFDISDPNPRNWSGAIFADAYSPAADFSGGDTGSASPTSPDWTALDSEAISVPPVIALDSTATVTMNFATGDQTTFNACYSVPGLSPAQISGTTNSKPNCTVPLQDEVNFLYSVREARGGGGVPFAHAQVNWYTEWWTGERVTGPMAVFNGILYFATYVPPGSTGTVCSEGGPNLYAYDFAKPPKAGCSSGATGDNNTQIGCGGDGTEDPNFNPTGSTPGQVTGTSLGGNVTANTIIPGVAVAATPSCTTTGTIPSDSYTGGAHTSTSATTAGTYSLMANIGKKSTAGANLVTQPIQTPAAPTIVDSWATIAE